MSQLNSYLSAIGGWRTIAAGVGLLAIVIILRKLLQKPAVDAHHRMVVCPCGWSGSVSRYKPRCPRCAGTDLHDA